MTFFLSGKKGLQCFHVGEKGNKQIFHGNNKKNFPRPSDPKIKNLFETGDKNNFFRPNLINLPSPVLY